MKRRFILSVLSFFIIFSLHSQDSNLMEELRLAGAISDTGLRLFTYDAILESYGLREKRQENDVGKWRRSTQIDPIDDSQIIYFSLTADSGVSVYGEPIELIVRHSSNGNELYVLWYSYMGSDAYVTMRIGTDVAEYDKWNMSTDNKATFYPGNTTELLNRLTNSDRFVVKSIPYSENPITAIFDIRGLKSIAEPYKDTLKWLE